MITIYHLQDKENPRIIEVALSCKHLTSKDEDSIYFYSFDFKSPIYHGAPYSLADTLLSRYHILQQIRLPTKEAESENSDLCFSAATVLAGCKKYIKECYNDKYTRQYEVQERSSKTYPLGLILFNACIKAGIQMPLEIMGCQTIDAFIEQVKILAEKLNSLIQTSHQAPLINQKPSYTL